VFSWVVFVAMLICRCIFSACIIWLSKMNGSSAIPALIAYSQNPHQSLKGIVSRDGVSTEAFGV
jgi:hypothetical protein